MNNRRQQKISKLLMEELSDILQKEVKAPGNYMVSMGNVKVTPDLRLARVYISVFPDKFMDEAVTWLRHNNKEIRMALAKRIKNLVRFIPELEFFEDDLLKTVDEVENLFKKVNPKDQSQGDEEE